MRARIATVLICGALGCGHAPADQQAPPQGDPVQSLEGEELFVQGVGLAQRGDLIRAEQYLAAAMDRGYPEERVMPVLIRVLVASSRLRVALDYSEPYLQRHPDDWALRYLVASIHLGMGEPERARRQLLRVVEAVPEQPEPHYLLAVVLRDELMQPGEAEGHFERYLELAPSGEHAGEAREALRRVPVPAPEQPTAAATADPPEDQPAADAPDDQPAADAPDDQPAADAPENDPAADAPDNQPAGSPAESPEEAP